MKIDNNLLFLLGGAAAAYYILKRKKIIEDTQLIPSVSVNTPIELNSDIITPIVVDSTPIFIDDTLPLEELDFIDKVYGCTDSLANNYNPDALQEDGSCAYTLTQEEAFNNPLPIVTLGCTDSSADNFNPYVNTDDGTCVYNTDNEYNNGNLECWTDECPNPSVASNPNWKSCPSDYPLTSPPICTVAPVEGLDISFDNLAVGVYNDGQYNTNDCVYSVDINITNMPQGYIWNMKRLSLINGIWKWKKSNGYETNSIMTSSSITKTGLCPGRYVVTILGNNGTYGGGMVMEKELIINPPPLPSIDVISTIPSGGSCNGGVRFVVRQRCSPSAPPWSNCNMSFSNKTKFRIRDNMNKSFLIKIINL